MDLPEHLWDDEADRDLVRGLTMMLGDAPFVLTDRLANSIYFSAPAEAIFGEASPAIVNRVAYSLLGIDDGRPVPPALAAALLGEREPWRAVLNPTWRRGHAMWVEASAVRRGEHFVCGVLRIGQPKEAGT